MKISTKIVVGVSFLIACILVLPKFGFSQIDFVQNKGQWDSKVRFKGEFSSGSVFIENKGFTVLLNKPEDLEKRFEILHGHSDNKTVPTPSPENPSLTQKRKDNEQDKSFIFHSFAYKVNFLGASNNAQELPENASESYNNYFIGNDKTKWAANVRIYPTIVYKNIYPNIDVRYYNNSGRMKYDFIVRPGGNVNAIAMRYDGATSLAIKDKELIIGTTVGDVKELYPYSYQAGDKSRAEVDCKYVLRDNVVTFQVKNYDATKTLVIDPSIIFSSFTGSRSDNWGFSATPGPDGSFFAGGIVFGDGYPATTGAFQTQYVGGSGEDNFDIGITKFSANGAQRLYATYIGGNQAEQPHSMIVDAQGNLIIAGSTNSGSTYPLVPAGNVIGPGGNYDIIITKLNATGNALLGSVRVGGKNADGINIRPKKDYFENGSNAESLLRNYGDDARSEVILDAANNIFLASCTSSDDFPVRNSPIQSSLGGLQDGVILKFNSNLTVPLFTTYFGGVGNDACFVLALNNATNSLYVGGGSASNNLPGNKVGTISPTYNDASAAGADGFVTELRTDGSAIIRTTYIGTSGFDIIYGLKLDRNGFPYVMGTTTGIWTQRNAAYFVPNGKQFIAKLQPDLSAYVYSTMFGKGAADPDISPVAFLVDRCQNVYVSGWGGGPNNLLRFNSGTTAGLLEVNPLPNIPGPDGDDFYFFVLKKDAGEVLFASHFGQNGGYGDHVDGGTSRFDENGVIYQAICGNCGGGVIFPTTSGVIGPRNLSTVCNEVALKISLNFAGVGANVKATGNGIANDTVGCVPFNVVFRDSLLIAKKYIWDFGDGSPRQTTFAPDNSIPHTYNSVGVFRAMLIAEDSSTCNIRDTVYINIKVGNNPVNLSFTKLKLPPCESLIMQYTNTSTPVYTAFGPKTFIWDYGDGSPRDTAGYLPPRVHAYATPGKYTVKLFLSDTTFCNSPDSVEMEVRIDAFVKAIFSTPARGCAPYTANFTNLSQAGTDFIWQFDNGTTFSTAVEPTYTFGVGTYRVRLIAIDLNTCNQRDTSAYFTINVIPKPVAQATWSPIPPIENVPVSFRNQSFQGAVRYLWNFGDGESSTQFEPVHEYNATGTYNAELIAYNVEGCTDTFPMSVTVIVLPLLDVPNAFTPGRFGDNGIVKVRGFGITKMQWRIYNRWGQLIFESANKTNGWDGTFKGKLQPLDVYTYTLDAEFSDGKKTRKTGDITLLR